MLTCTHDYKPTCVRAYIHTFKNACVHRTYTGPDVCLLNVFASASFLIYASFYLPIYLCIYLSLSLSRSSLYLFIYVYFSPTGLYLSTETAAPPKISLVKKLSPSGTRGKPNYSHTARIGQSDVQGSLWFPDLGVPNALFCSSGCWRAGIGISGATRLCHLESRTTKVRKGLDFGFWASGKDQCLSICVLIYRSVIYRFVYLPIYF